METSQYQSPDVSGLYDRYAAMLYRLSYAALQSQPDAEDAVAEVFVKYISKTPSFHDVEHERAWFVRVCVNQCHDLQRRKKIRLYTPIDEMSETLAEEESAVGILEDVLQLPEKYKTVILLYYFEDFSIDAIAQSLGIGKSAVKMRLARGRDLLKTQIERNL